MAVRVWLRRDDQSSSLLASHSRVTGVLRVVGRDNGLKDSLWLKLRERECIDLEKMVLLVPLGQARMCRAMPSWRK